MKNIYLDCFSGISGDMTLAALVDAGADRDYIESELAKIRIEPFTLEWKRVNKRGVSALKMDVLLDPAQPPTHHRHYSEIVRLIESAGFNDRVKAYSLAIFEKIGLAESKIHDIPLSKVHFHEVGAIDSIVDVIGVALALDSLDADKIICSPVPLGSGMVNCDHGLYPVPAPATLEMMRGLPVAPCAYRLEMTTPTGAGIVSGTAVEFSASIPPMIVESIGYGAGTRDLPNQPNVLRVIVGRTVPYLEKWQTQHEFLQQAEQPQEHPHPHHHEHGHGHRHAHDHGHEHRDGDDHHHDHGHDHDDGHDHVDGHDHHHGHAHDDGHGHGHDHHLDHGQEHHDGHKHEHEHHGDDPAHDHKHKHAHDEHMHKHSHKHDDDQQEHEQEHKH